jgi:hypothetical protein
MKRKIEYLPSEMSVPHELTDYQNNVVNYNVLYVLQQC